MPRQGQKWLPIDIYCHVKRIVSPAFEYGYALWNTENPTQYKQYILSNTKCRQGMSIFKPLMCSSFYCCFFTSIRWFDCFIVDWPLETDAFLKKWIPLYTKNGSRWSLYKTNCIVTQDKSTSIAYTLIWADKMRRNMYRFV